MGIPKRQTHLIRNRQKAWSEYVSWAYSYRGKPVEFIGELMGNEWWTDDWASWRVFVKTLFGLPLDGETELLVFQKCTGLATPTPGRQHRTAWVPVGRRGGKSRVMAMIVVYLACCFDYSPHLAPGEMGFVAVLSDSRDHSTQIMNYVKGVLKNTRLSSLVMKPLVESIELRNQVTIEIVTASIKAVRSRTVVAAICDEIAFWQADETMANPDVEILSGLRPTMATIPTAMLIATSNRYARRGALWNAYRDWYGKEEGPLVWSADTKTMHPSIDQKFLDEEYELDPIAAAAEYGLEWRSDVAAFVDAELIALLTPRGLTETQPLSNVEYVAFVDPSGGAQDSFAMAIAHREFRDAGDLAILDRAVEFQAPFSPEHVVESICDELSRWGVTTVKGDQYAGEWPGEQFRKRGVDYKPSELTKSEIYREAMPVMTARKAQLLDIARLRHQILALERRAHRGGRDSIDHPPGGHDDVANAALGAIVEVMVKRFAPLWTPTHMPLVA